MYLEDPSRISSCGTAIGDPSEFADFHIKHLI